MKNHAKGARLDTSGSENCDTSSVLRSKPDLPDLPSPDAVTVTSRVATVTVASLASAASAGAESRAMTVSTAASVSTSTAPRPVSFMESAPAWPLVVCTSATSPARREGSMTAVKEGVRLVHAVPKDAVTRTTARAAPNTRVTPH